MENSAYSRKLPKSAREVNNSLLHPIYPLYGCVPKKLRQSWQEKAIHVTKHFFSHLAFIWISLFFPPPPFFKALSIHVYNLLDRSRVESFFKKKI